MLKVFVGPVKLRFARMDWIFSTAIHLFLIFLEDLQEWIG